jgi:3-oxoacyl-[acyl-carrier protein] reductase
MIETGLRDKVVLVTGCSSGIGLATAKRFAEEGARVTGWDVREAPGDFPGNFRHVDVADSNAVNDTAAELDRESGGIHALINNAGILRDSQLVKFKDGAVQSVLDDERWASVIGVNLNGVFHCARAVARHMIERGEGGVILNASSVVGIYGNFGQTNYVATKAGVIGMTKVWARELGRYKIRVNAVAPGFIQTEMTAAMPEKILASMVEHTPIGRLGKPEDVAEAYVWLASDAASFIHGIVLSVDGGVVTGT